MPLDPLVKAFLDQAAAMPRPKMWDMPLAVRRQGFADMMGLVGPQGRAGRQDREFRHSRTGRRYPRPRLCAGRGAAARRCRRWSIFMAAALWWAIWTPMTGCAA